MHSVLIVEDEDLLRDNLRLLVEELGYHVLTAANGAEALQRWVAETVDIVLTDLQMPGMDGYEMLRQARWRGFTQPVIVLTAQSSADQVIRALRLGASDYVLKPFDLVTLEEALQRAEQALIVRGNFNSLIHDLRQPVASMVMTLQLLIRDETSIAPTERATLMQESIRRGQQLLSQLSALGRC